MERLPALYTRLLMGALILTAPSCYFDFGDDDFACRHPRGPVVTETHILPEFEEITNTIGATVTIRQDVDRQFQITAAENILDAITLRVVNGELIIDAWDCINNASVDIYISIPHIHAVNSVGSGNIYGENLWEEDNISLTLTGSGHIDVELSADVVYSEINGSGRIDLYGHTALNIIDINGSGNIYAFGLESDEQDVSISGSGNCEVFAREHLEVVISGSGNVYYKGNPQVSASITGSGSVINAN